MKNKSVVRDYEKNGYIISKSLLEENEILSLRSELDEEFIDQKEGVSRFLENFKNRELDDIFKNRDR